MMRRLENLEAEHPETVTPDSPTQHVGGHRSEKFSPVHHAVPLESLSDVFSYEELTDFIRKTNETLGVEPLYTVEPKIDGLSMALEYRNGVFYQGFARGATAETPAIHADWPEDDITIVVYFTSGLPADCGTSL